MNLCNSEEERKNAEIFKINFFQNKHGEKQLISWEMKHDIKYKENTRPDLITTKC